MIFTRDRRHLWGLGLWCACCVAAGGCGDYISGMPTPPSTAGARSPVQETSGAAASSAQSTSPADALANSAGATEIAAATGDSTGSGVQQPEIPTTNVGKSNPVPKDRVFTVEGPNGALRISYDDLDLLKLLRMDPVTADCVEKMPGWLMGLNGKQVRLRGYMKPALVTTDIPQFTFVKDTGLCCFGPKGKIYDMVTVTLKEGTTTDYIELRPFDVVGTFRIEVVQLDPGGELWGLYFIDDAQILRK